MVGEVADEGAAVTSCRFDMIIPFYVSRLLSFRAVFVLAFYESIRYQREHGRIYSMASRIFGTLFL
jgi:hypothetical protein